MALHHHKDNPFKEMSGSKSRCQRTDMTNHTFKITPTTSRPSCFGNESNAKCILHKESPPHPGQKIKIAYQIPPQMKPHKEQFPKEETLQLHQKPQPPLAAGPDIQVSKINRATPPETDTH
ncbi:hypothetical protein Nepgr_015990 [Nepenthes gracilis]|uniref:Uncharacterized protein n=1 Tax=Nepenthes gracilis TaxID=150966 RepID=A0AAD3SNT3_NEPGR|nr:hypothetical protein Nepgr_015990 [Nepenthes gracilis]